MSAHYDGPESVVSAVELGVDWLGVHYGGWGGRLVYTGVDLGVRGQDKGKY